VVITVAISVDDEVPITQIQIADNDTITFGTDQDEGSLSLLLVGTATQFEPGIHIWLRMRLSQSIGTTEIEFFLQEASKTGGWSPIASWAIDTDPDYNIYVADRSELAGLEPGKYKVFVATNGEKRAEGEFTVKSDRSR
jgi:hypothetical protein